MKAKKLMFGSFKPLQAGLEKIFGGLEAAIMECLWDEGKANVRYVYGCLSKKREIAYTTVMTVMGRLSDKGFLIKEKSGNAYLYTPSVSREDLEKTVVGSVLAGLADQLTSGALAQFVDAISKNDTNALDELEKLIAQKRQENDKV
jgi:predicted transcriptional regulator